jgi:hypothetical protein
MDLESLIRHTERAVYNASINSSKLTDEILEMEGMSGYKTRHLYNNVCNLPGAKYLEVGTWKGSSFISALYGNMLGHSYCVDNWSEFNDSVWGKDPYSTFRTNVDRYLGEGRKDLTILNKNCWDVTLHSQHDIGAGSIDVFMYDGEHSYEAQKRAITHYAPFFSKYVIIMIDDWECDWWHVRDATYEGLDEAGLKIHYVCEIPRSTPFGAYHCGGNTFWNGCGVFVCESKQN